MATWCPCSWSTTTWIIVLQIFVLKSRAFIQPAVHSELNPGFFQSAVDNSEIKTSLPDKWSTKKNKRSGGKVISLSLMGKPTSGYYVALSFGWPSQTFHLMVDTGSSNTGLIGYLDDRVGTYYRSPGATEDLHQSVSVRYTVGGWSGHRVRGVVQLATNPRLNLTVTFDLIDSDQDFFAQGNSWAGIWGMAYSSLVKPSPTPTFWDQLRAQLLLSDSFSLHMCPPLDNLDTEDVLEDGLSWMDLGGYRDDDSRVRNSSLHYSTPIPKGFPQTYYIVTVTDIRVGEHSLSMDCKEFNNDSVIVDSGTTDIYFPVAVVTAIKDLIHASLKPFGNVTLASFRYFLDGQMKLAINRYSLLYLFSHLPSLKIGLPLLGDPSRQFYLVIPPQLYLQETTGSVEEELEAGCYEDCDFFYFAVKPRERGGVIGALAMMGYYINFDLEAQAVHWWPAACDFLVNASLPTLAAGPDRDPSINCSCADCPVTAAYSWLLAIYVLTAVAMVIMLLTLQVTHTRLWMRRKPQFPGCLSLFKVWLLESFCFGIPRTIAKVAGFVCGRVVRSKIRYSPLVAAQEDTNTGSGTEESAGMTVAEDCSDDSSLDQHTTTVPNPLHSLSAGSDTASLLSPAAVQPATASPRSLCAFGYSEVKPGLSVAVEAAGDHEPNAPLVPSRDLPSQADYSWGQVSGDWRKPTVMVPVKIGEHTTVIMPLPPVQQPQRQQQKEQQQQQQQKDHQQKEQQQQQKKQQQQKEQQPPSYDGVQQESTPESSQTAQPERHCSQIKQSKLLQRRPIDFHSGESDTSSSPESSLSSSSSPESSLSLSKNAQSSLSPFKDTESPLVSSKSGESSL